MIDLSDRTKEIILKTVIVIGLSALILMFPGSLIYCWFLDENTVNTLLMGSEITFFVFGVLLMILLPLFGLKQKPTKAEKIPLPFDEYDSLANHIASSAKSNNYAPLPELSLVNDGTLSTYIKPSGMWKVDCIALVRVVELTDDGLDSANNAITESLKEYYGKDEITDTVNMITIVCVDRITSAFQKLVNSNIQQGFKNGRLPVGISFGGKTIYIAKQKDGFAIAKYRKLRKEFLRILQL